MPYLVVVLLKRGNSFSQVEIELISIVLIRKGFTVPQCYVIGTKYFKQISHICFIVEIFVGGSEKSTREIKK